MATNDLYEVLIVKYGTRSTVASDVYLNFHLYGESDRPIDMDYFFWVARNAERTICIDTGFSQAGALARKRTFVADPADAYRKLNVNPADKPTVIVTHAHYDHIGNLDLFPQSQIVMAEAEFDFWNSKYGIRKQFHHSVEDVEIELLRNAHAEGRVTLFNKSLDLFPGIQLIQVGGHTPGQTMVRVSTSDGDVLLASDAIHYYEEYERDMPFAFVANLPQMYQSFDLIREMVDQGEVQHLVSGHDPDTLNRFPAANELPGLAAVIGRIDS
ncbi:MAG TPA: N-acyl homoserine lactonase family protein [Candidatus Nanopelagicaceae bacterium]